MSTHGSDGDTSTQSCYSGLRRKLTTPSRRSKRESSLYPNADKMKTRQPTSSEQAIIDEVLTLYQLKSTDESYSHYRSDAVFHDPVSIAQGLDSIKSQFNGMPKLFERSDTRKCEVIIEGDENSIALNLTQHCFFNGNKMLEKTLNSKVTLKLGPQGMIQHHEEQWEHQPNRISNDGFMGALQEWRKKAGAKLVEAA